MVQYFFHVFGFVLGPSCQSSFWGCSERTCWCFHLAGVAEGKLYVPRWMQHRAGWKLKQVTCLSPEPLLAFLRVFGLFPMCTMVWAEYCKASSRTIFFPMYLFSGRMAFLFFPFRLQDLYRGHGKQLETFLAFCSNPFRFSIEWLSLFFTFRPLR